jgi:DNA-directed RNA polymerase specialized sigma24 family protein
MNDQNWNPEHLEHLARLLASEAGQRVNRSAVRLLRLQGATAETISDVVHQTRLRIAKAMQRGILFKDEHFAAFFHCVARQCMLDWLRRRAAASKLECGEVRSIVIEDAPADVVHEVCSIKTRIILLISLVPSVLHDPNAPSESRFKARDFLLWKTSRGCVLAV